MVVHDPSTDARSHAMGIIRVGSGEVLTVRLSSEEPVYFGTHWSGKRQLICPGEICPLCGGDGARNSGFIACQLLRAGAWTQPLLLGVSFQAMIGFSERCRFLSLREAPGLELEARRARKNSPLRMEPTRVSMEQLQTTDRHALITAVAYLHSLPIPGRSEKISAWEARIAQHAARLLF